MNKNKALKWVVGIVLFLALPSLLFFGALHWKYNEELPKGIQGAQADSLAIKMMDALNYKNYKSTNYLEWTFKKRHHYNWKKGENSCTVYWKEFKVDLDLIDYSKSKAFVHGFEVDGDQAENLIKKAIRYFNNDSFWLVAPFKVFDEGTERRLVKTESGDDALLVTYTTGGSTPGDSYLWYLDKDYKPKSFKMWVSIIPIKGLEASWEKWVTTKSGAILPSFHKILFLGISLNDIKGTL